MSMPAWADINNSMQNLTGTSFLTSEQHEDTTKARQERAQVVKCSGLRSKDEKVIKSAKRLIDLFESE